MSLLVVAFVIGSIFCNVVRSSALDYAQKAGFASMVAGGGLAAVSTGVARHLSKKRAAALAANDRERFNELDALIKKIVLARNTGAGVGVAGAGIMGASILARGKRRVDTKVHSLSESSPKTAQPTHSQTTHSPAAQSSAAQSSAIPDPATPSASEHSGPGADPKGDKAFPIPPFTPPSITFVFDSFEFDQKVWDQQLASLELERAALEAQRRRTRRIIDEWVDGIMPNDLRKTEGGLFGPPETQPGLMLKIDDIVSALGDFREPRYFVKKIIDKLCLEGGKLSADKFSRSTLVLLAQKKLISPDGLGLLMTDKMRDRDNTYQWKENGVIWEITIFNKGEVPTSLVCKPDDFDEQAFFQWYDNNISLYATHSSKDKNIYSTHQLSFAAARKSHYLGDDRRRFFRYKFEQNPYDAPQKLDHYFKAV